MTEEEKQAILEFAESQRKFNDDLIVTLTVFHQSISKLESDVLQLSSEMDSAIDHIASLEKTIGRLRSRLGYDC